MDNDADNVSDPFDEILNLESQYHTEGYNLGVADGARSGRIEGRVFGLEKGFEKFVDIGRLNGKAAVWNARLKTSITSEAHLEGSERLRKHVTRLSELTNPETVPTENDEDSVSEFDDRLKDAKAKGFLIEKIVGEDHSLTSTETAGSGETSNLFDKGSRLKQNARVKQSGEMEDFVGLPRGKKDVT